MKILHFDASCIFLSLSLWSPTIHYWSGTAPQHMYISLNATFEAYRPED